MPRIRTVSVVYERKINLGNYHSAHLGLTLWADLDEGDDAEAVTRDLQSSARRYVKDEFQRLKAADPATTLTPNPS